MRPLVIGQAPSATSDPLEPLAGPCGARLASLCGLSIGDWLGAYERFNLVERFPGKLAKGDAWDADCLDEAEDTAAIIHTNVLKMNPRPTVLLGRRVFDAFKPVWGWRAGWGAPALGDYNVEGRQYRVCPHPSGVCRWWNDPFNVGQARSFWLRIERECRP